MLLSRRSFIKGAGTTAALIVAAPAIVRAANIMPVKSWVAPIGPLTIGSRSGISVLIHGTDALGNRLMESCDIEPGASVSTGRFFLIDSIDMLSAPVKPGPLYTMEWTEMPEPYLHHVTGRDGIIWGGERIAPHRPKLVRPTSHVQDIVVKRGDAVVFHDRVSTHARWSWVSTPDTTLINPRVRVVPLPTLARSWT